MRPVSITLQNTGDARPIIEAIHADNPEAKASQFPAMVKIDCPGRLVIKRDTVEELMGREWDVQELQLTLISLSGNVDESDDEFVIAWG